LLPLASSTSTSPIRRIGRPIVTVANIAAPISTSMTIRPTASRICVARRVAATASAVAASAISLEALVAAISSSCDAFSAGVAWSFCSTPWALMVSIVSFRTPMNSGTIASSESIASFTRGSDAVSFA
jgi:hypothetical protein